MKEEESFTDTVVGIVRKNQEEVKEAVFAVLEVRDTELRRNLHYA